MSPLLITALLDDGESESKDDLPAADEVAEPAETE